MAWTGKLYLYLYYPDVYPDRLRKSRKVRIAGLRGQETILEHFECEGVLLFNHTSLQMKVDTVTTITDALTSLLLRQMK
jgi:hypothetical protein